jgi:Ca2+-transporting ATPase
VAEGSAKAVVVETGMKTEIGKITQLVKEAEEEMTPLQRRLDSFGKKLSYAQVN